MSSNSGHPRQKVGASTETVKEYTSYADASVASCKWVNSGREKIDPSQLQHYIGRLQSSSAHGKVVGLGLQGASTVIPYVRLDMDNTGKGIHFNATQLSDPSKKFAAVIKPTKDMTQADRTALYLDYVGGIADRSTEVLWRWWSTGIPPSQH